MSSSFRSNLNRKTKTTTIKERSRFLLSKMLSMIHCLCYINMMIMANYLTTGASAISHTNFSTDQSALLTLKAHITSDPQNILTANWSSASNFDICNWVGVSCGAGHHRVTALNLSHMGLAGVIPPHLGNLSFLVELGLKNNSFHGPLPQELSRLRRLKAINFGNNSFMGTIPSWFGSFPKLQTIKLYGNGFSGFIPAAILNLSALEIINLSRNQLSGSTPREIGNLTMVKGIYLDDNKFEELPNEIGSLGQLEELFVRDNALKGSAFVPVLNISSLTTLALFGNNMSGNLPDNICEHLPSIRIFNLGRNQFDGLIPSKLWQCKELRELTLGYNNFRGSIPKSLCNLTYLTEIYLDNNNLTGSIPREIGNLTMVKVISLRDNKFEELPNEMSSLGQLEELYVQSNALKGSALVPVLNISSLTTLALYGNNMSGNLPDNICERLPSIRIFNLGRNQFDGLIPSKLWQCKELRELNLEYNNFRGSIPKSLGNLTYLTKIYLGNNNLTGSIPREIGNLTMVKVISLDDNKFEELPNEMSSLGQLEELYVQFNALKGSALVPVLNISSLTTLALYGNNMSGNLPDNICEHLPSIRIFNLGRNQFDGLIPSKLWQCKELRELNLEDNNFRGSIPKSLGNLTYLTEIYLDSNNLTGTIPDEISDLLQLEALSLGINNLSGVIPSKLFNLSMIRIISFSFNQLSGSLPANIGLNVPNLEFLYVARNNLVGRLLPNLSNASKLKVLDMDTNSFTGFLPSTLCSLKNLQVLNLHSNNLTIDASTPQAASTLSCLFNLRNLTRLSLEDNPLNTMIPASHRNLSTSLLYVGLRNSNIRGNIPVDIGNLSSLISLNLGNNQLRGAIPTSIQRLQNLQGLYLYNNELRGHIPDELCQLDNLAELSLGGNRLFGSIPSCLGTLAVALRGLFLGSNSLTSKVPSSLWELKYILYLNLSSNYLVGPLSEDIGKLKDVLNMDLSNNHFSGNIPSSIGDLQNMITLSLANNYLEGPIPSSFKTLLSLEFLDMSKNNLSGVIPKSLEALLYLKHLNLSFNKLQGEIPTDGPFGNFSADSFVSNGALCGASRFHVPLCKYKTAVKPNWRKTICIISGVMSVILLAVAALILILCRKRNVEVVRETALLHQVLWRRVSRLELVKATNGLHESNLLGTGGFSSVYRGTLSDRIHIAVKVFNLQQEGAFKSFDKECEMLSNIRHRNLIKIISCCDELDFKALVLQLMPNGSLEQWLYSPKRSLNILQRLDIMKDVALALEYLHHGYSIPIVHCDVKPSNILLDDDMVAHVADFGIARLVSGGDSMTETMTLATVGYMAPEFGIEGSISMSGDVYSFGIVLIETFTKRKPTDEMFVGEMNLKQWIADSLFPDAAIDEVVDADILGTEEDGDFVSKRDCLSSIMRLALACTAALPRERINMKDAAISLTKIKTRYLKDCEGVNS